ncbi:MAG TPA: hypothetical protein PKV36_22655, partial [Leptospiraceae bacterium]|nr:hypothetical protein [Leptospiraceae bacterium]
NFSVRYKREKDYHIMLRPIVSNIEFEHGWAQMEDFHYIDPFYTIALIEWSRDTNKINVKLLPS